MKTSIILSVAVLFLSCGGNTKQNEADDIVTVPAETISQAVIVDEHNAKNSLDYVGTYTGLLPAASSSGMEVTIVLADSIYTKDVKHIGKEAKPMSSKGQYTWNDAGNTITLVGEVEPNQYFVGENTLTQLDINGEKIVGEMESKFVLRK